MLAAADPMLTGFIVKPISSEATETSLVNNKRDTLKYAF
jgi:hypothetical protein